MGIQGLIQFLEKASCPVSLEDIRGYTVAVDSYCWLHKGAFGCADQLSRGEDTDKYVWYCLKYVDLLLSYDIKPILVFDGRHLPAKALTEKRRRESREQSKKRAAELLRLGQIEQARSHMRRCVDITHEMAHKLMVECRKRNVDCIVAPYEADAQLAYLNKLNVAQYVITEDSDLVLFGCNKVIFKLDLNGKGVMVDTEKIYLAMKCRKDKYTFDMFRNMCVLSGCDYLDSLPGIGLAKACRFFCRTEETDMKKALTKVPAYLNMKNLVVTEEYIENFLKADATFRFMYVFDPFKRAMVRLNELPEHFDESLCSNAGSLCDSETALQLALGNLNPFSLKRLDDWNPDKDSQSGNPSRSISWSNRGKSKHRSIWQSNFKVHEPGKSNDKEEDTSCAIEFKRYVLKDANHSCYELAEVQQTESEILSIYATQEEEPPVKRHCPENELTPPNGMTTPQKATKSRNPFLKLNCDPISPTNLDSSPNSLLKSLSPRKVLEKKKPSLPKLSNFNRTVINPERKVLSRFFKNSNCLSKKTNFAKEQQLITTPEKSLDSLGSTIAEIQKTEERQLQEATVLYLSSPEATLSERGDKTPPRIDSFPESIVVSSVQAFDSGIDVSSNEKDDAKIDNLPKELLEKFQFKVKSKDLRDLKEEAETIVLSDEESSQKAEVILKKSKPIVRRIGLAKPRNKKIPHSDSTQSKLSKFFYKKKPAL